VLSVPLEGQKMFQDKLFYHFQTGLTKSVYP
jgi:hypothetical protein